MPYHQSWRCHCYVVTHVQHIYSHSYIPIRLGHRAVVPWGVKLQQAAGITIQKLLLLVADELLPLPHPVVLHLLTTCTQCILLHLHFFACAPLRSVYSQVASMTGCCCIALSGCRVADCSAKLKSAYCRKLQASCSALALTMPSGHSSVLPSADCHDQTGAMLA